MSRCYGELGVVYCWQVMTNRDSRGLYGNSMMRSVDSDALNITYAIQVFLPITFFVWLSSNLSGCSPSVPEQRQVGWMFSDC